MLAMVVGQNWNVSVRLGSWGLRRHVRPSSCTTCRLRSTSPRLQRAGRLGWRIYSRMFAGGWRRMGEVWLEG
jgi:hypothetical protein